MSEMMMRRVPEPPAVPFRAAAMSRTGLLAGLRRGALSTAAVLAFALVAPGVAGIGARPAMAADYVNRPSLVVQAGVQTPLSLSSPIERVAIGDPATVTGRVVGPTDILLLGLKPGRTNLIVWEVGGETAYVYPVIVPLGTGDLAHDLREDPELAGVKVDGTGGKIALKGTVPSNDAHARALRLASRAISRMASATRSRSCSSRW